MPMSGCSWPPTERLGIDMGLPYCASIQLDSLAMGRLFPGTGQLRAKPIATNSERHSDPPQAEENLGEDRRIYDLRCRAEVLRNS